MSWNFRVIKSVEDGEEMFGIHECFYNEGQQIPHSWTIDPVRVSGDNVRWVLEQMLLSLDKAVLEVRDNKLVVLP